MLVCPNVCLSSSWSLSFDILVRVYVKYSLRPVAVMLVTPCQVRAALPQRTLRASAREDPPPSARAPVATASPAQIALGPGLSMTKRAKQCRQAELFLDDTGDSGVGMRRIGGQ